MKREIVFFVLLVTVGCLQAVGDVLGIATLKNLGLASHASPAPRVFTAQQGFETFSSRFFIEYMNKAGETIIVPLDPERYASVRGPYNRRNAYGATLSYGPVLASSEVTADMYFASLEYTFCGESRLLEEVGLPRPSPDKPIVLRVEPTESLSRSLNLPFTQLIRCES
tara:strand:- start:1308 stop:1811 length:504 start_codon:yes stop_codon:yes gene_type:complete